MTSNPTSPANLVTRSRHLEPWDPDGAKQLLEEVGRQILYALAPDCQYPVPSDPTRYNSVAYEFDESRTRHGTDRGGFVVIVRREYYERGAASLSRESLVLESYGMPEGCSFLVDHREARLSVTLQGPADAIDRVLHWFDRHIAKPPDDDVLAARATESVYALSRGDWEAAMAGAKSVLELRPDHPDALLALGVASGATGDLETADSTLRRLLDSNPRHVDALYNLGNVQHARKDATAAVETFRRVLAVDPKNHPAAFQLAQALEAQGGPDAKREAVEAYELTIATSPNPGGAWGYRGLDFTKRAEAALTRLRSSR